MADKDNKLEQNVSGKYYVDSDCIDCDACQATAPENFGRDDDAGMAYVKKQPENEDEMLLCQDALDACPVESIGDDGDE